MLRAIKDMHMLIAPNINVNIRHDMAIIFQPALVDDFNAVACVKNLAFLDNCSPTVFKSSLV